MNYEYFFVKQTPKKCKIFRVYSFAPEEAIVILARELGCAATDSDEAAKFLTKLNVRPIRVETVFGEGQPWTETQHLHTARPH